MGEQGIDPTIGQRQLAAREQGLIDKCIMEHMRMRSAALIPEPKDTQLRQTPQATNDPRDHDLGLPSPGSRSTQASTGESHPLTMFSRWLTRDSGLTTLDSLSQLFSLFWSGSLGPQTSLPASEPRTRWVLTVSPTASDKDSIEKTHPFSPFSGWPTRHSGFTTPDSQSHSFSLFWPGPLRLEASLPAPEPRSNRPSPFPEPVPHKLSIEKTHDFSLFSGWPTRDSGLTTPDSQSHLFSLFSGSPTRDSGLTTPDSQYCFGPGP
jgi:hypothetical protein